MIELNLTITLPEETGGITAGRAFIEAARILATQLLRSGVPEVDEQVQLDNNVLFYRSE